MLFDFNFYSSLLLPAFIQGVLFAIILFVRGFKMERLSDRLLAALLLLNSLKIAYWMLGFADWYDSHDGYTTFMFYFPFSNLLIISPLVYFYFLSLTNHQFRFQKKHWPHFILPVAWLLLIVGKLIVDFGWHHPFANSPSTQYGTKGPYADLDKTDTTYIISYISFFYYLWLSIKTYKSYQQYIVANFSATDEISYTWVRNLLYALAAAVIIFLAFGILDEIFHWGEKQSYKYVWYAHFILGLFVYYISIAGYNSPSKQPLLFNPAEQPVTTEKTVVTNDANEVAIWKNQLQSFIEKHQPYLEPELSLALLAHQMNVPSSHLSKMINESMEQNFNDFINSYRVKAFIQKLESGEQATQTLLGIAYDCGFNSKATFNRAFKKDTGMSPKEWLVKHP